MDEHWGVVANVIDDRLFRRGAKVWLHFLPGDGGKIEVYGLSRGGRAISRWVRVSQLRDIRPDMTVSDNPEMWAYDHSRTKAQERADILRSRLERAHELAVSHPA